MLAPYREKISVQRRQERAPISGPGKSMSALKGTQRRSGFDLPPRREPVQQPCAYDLGSSGRRGCERSLTPPVGTQGIQYVFKVFPKLCVKFISNKL